MVSPQNNSGVDLSHGLSHLSLDDLGLTPYIYIDLRSYWGLNGILLHLRGISSRTPPNYHPKNSGFDSCGIHRQKISHWGYLGMFPTHRPTRSPQKSNFPRKNGGFSPQKLFKKHLRIWSWKLWRPWLSWRTPRGPRWSSGSLAATWGAWPRHGWWGWRRSCYSGRRKWEEEMMSCPESWCFFT